MPWLLGLVPQSVLQDIFAAHLPSLVRLARKVAFARLKKTKDNLAAESAEMIQRSIRNQAQLARRMGFSRARIMQVLGPLSS